MNLILHLILILIHLISWTAWISIRVRVRVRVRVYFILQNLAPLALPYMCPQPRYIIYIYTYIYEHTELSNSIYPGTRNTRQPSGVSQDSRICAKLLSRKWCISLTTGISV